jgi:dienelactone hydrolase
VTQGKDPSRRRVPARTRRSAPARAGIRPTARRDLSSHLQQQRDAASRARVIRRRRAGVLVATLVLVGAIVAACNAVSSAGPHGKTSTTDGTSPSSTSPTPTTMLPATFEVGIHTFAWVETGPHITHIGPTGLPIAGRVLTTEVRYPTLAGAVRTEAVDARPTTVGGPYPVIVFAQGWDTEPSSYQEMLDAWVSAGFVVVSPIFPDENTAAVSAAGGPGTSAALTEEGDEYNEPGDIVYVLKQLETVTSHGWGATLKGVLNMSDVALAGQSDGANVVAALSYASGLKNVRAELPVAPKAVAVMSGFSWTYLPPDGEAGTYAASSASPALLQIQSDADGCVQPYGGSSNPPPTSLFAALQTGLTSKWWVTLLDADHLGPFEGTAPWAQVVDAVTTKFFELELNWRSSSVSSSILSAGTVSGAAKATTTVTSATVPVVTLIPGC